MRIAYRGNKYRNKIVEISGIKFHSQKEGKRYQELVLMQQAGVISDLELQPRFSLEVAGQKVCVYVSDFKYTDTKTGHKVVEDVKGFRTPEYKIKAKLFQILYPQYHFLEI